MSECLYKSVFGTVIPFNIADFMKWQLGQLFSYPLWIIFDSVSM